MATRKIKIGTLHEQIILGSMLTNKKLRKQLTTKLSPTDFAAPRHRTIFIALQELTERRLDYVPATLKSFLSPNEEDWGGFSYLQQLEDSKSEENIEHHLERARWDNARSTILNRKIDEFEAALKDPRFEVDHALSLAGGLIDCLKQARGQSSIIRGTAIAARYIANLHARESGDRIRTTGYVSLDKKITNPFGRGLISIIASAPSIGKTTLSLNMAKRQSKKWKVGYLAWESGSVAATDIMVASELNIPLSKLVKTPSQLTKKEQDSMEEFLSNLYEKNENLSFLKRPSKAILKDTSGPWEINDKVLDWFESELEAWDRDIIFWDLFEKELPDRRPQAISWALDRVQRIAQDYGVHLALLHQITFKEVEKQADKRPTRGFLKGSGGYIEVPDMVYGLYRRAVYDHGIQDKELEVYCLKQRIGPWPWRIVMDWNGEICKVSGGREVQMTVIDDELENDI